MKTGKRRRADSSSSEEEETTLVRRKISAKVKSEDSLIKTEDLQLSKEAQEEKDARERDEFAARLINKDLKNTKKLGIEEEIDVNVDVDRLREESRRRYLELRSKKELQLLELAIKDEEEVSI